MSFKAGWILGRTTRYITDFEIIASLIIGFFMGSLVLLFVGSIIETTRKVPYECAFGVAKDTTNGIIYYHCKVTP